MAETIKVQGKEVTIISRERQDYISLTDIAKYRNNDAPADIVKNWLRTRSTVEFLGLWEQLNNPGFKLVEFDQFRNEAGANHFVLSPQKWIETTSAIGLISRSGRYGGTYAHKDIAFEFASWISPQFKLYLITEFQRLKDQERQQLGWDIRRNLAKINYRIHTDAIKQNLIPPELTPLQTNLIYASEADVLNMALFGMTAREWRDSHAGDYGNIRDFANMSQFVCLSNGKPERPFHTGKGPTGRAASDERLQIQFTRRGEQVMALHPDFPESAYAILDPAIRWFHESAQKSDHIQTPTKGPTHLSVSIPPNCEC